MTFDPTTLTETKFDKRQERAVRNEGAGSTDGAMAIVQKFITDTTHFVSLKIAEGLTDLKTTRKADTQDLIDIISNINPSVLALVSLQVGISSVAACDNLTKTIMAMGMALEREVAGQKLKLADKALAARLEKAAKKRHGSLKHRRQAVRSMAKKAGYKPGQSWSKDEVLRAGQWCMEVCMASPVFVLVTNEGEEGEASGSYLTLTEEAMAVSDRFIAKLLEDYPAHVPTITRPDNWKDTETTYEVSGKAFKARLVRKRCSLTQGAIKAAIKDGRLQPSLDALNAAQGVPWAVNEAIVEAVQFCYEHKIPVEGLPSQDDLPFPAKDGVWDEMDDKAKLAWRRKASKIDEMNRSLIGTRLILDQDIETAKWLINNGNRFYTLMNWDYRGRVYGVPHFNFQRQDYVRGMFTFADGKPLGETGLYWLKVHAANCGDFGKISKAPFDDRVKWVNENSGMIIYTAVNWKTDHRWTKADSPFLFLAACIELHNAWRDSTAENYVCSIPVSFDGSCSGLQHLCAMTRAEEGILVNLGQTATPGDVYQTVAEKVASRVKADLANPSLDALAQQALDYGVNRSLVKRNVMTYSYSSKKFGMGQQLREDTMKPLELQVLSGELDAHPFGEDNGYKAATYLAGITYDAIEETVAKPAEAMRFLQGIARALAHEGKPTTWHTPLGFPVLLRYPNDTTDRVSLYLSDRGVNVHVKVNITSDAPGINKSRAANAVAPSFVHSLDACHLMMVANEAVAQGITNLAFVHDSFGCLPADAQAFRQCIVETFVKLYSENDVLQDILVEAHNQIQTNSHRLPELPAYGSLDINEVRHADFAFA